jgi:hypothetical protein
MSNKQIYSKAYPIRLTFDCEEAWCYLKKCKISPAKYLREGGEQLVINKAKEFKLKQKQEYLPF